MDNLLKNEENNDTDYDKFYLTESLFYDFNKKKTYFEKKIDDKNDIKNNIKNQTKNILINKKNYKKYFGLYEWQDIDYLWAIQLDDTYMLLECGSGGDCLFSSVAEALNLNNIYLNKITEYCDAEILRKQASSMIDENNFDIIIETYKLEKEHNEFDGNWDPNTINNIEDLKNEIESLGHNFWGDHITLQLLALAIKKFYNFKD